MKTFSISIVIICLLTVLAIQNSFFLTTAQPANTQNAGTTKNDLQIGAVTFKQLSTVRISGLTRSIWENSNNTTLSPSAWLFALEPFLIPETDATGKLVTSIRLADSSVPAGFWRLQFSLVTIPASARDRALKEILAAKKPALTELRNNQLLSLEMGQLAVLIPSLSLQYPKCKLGDDTVANAPATTQFWDVNGIPDDRFDVVINCPTQKMVENVRQFISGQNILYSYTYKGRNSIRNSTDISLSQLKTSQLYLRLFGNAKNNIAYVHRDDLRLLSESVQNTVRATYVIEDPKNFSDAFSNGFIENYTKSISLTSKDFDDQKFQSTYNKDDLRPDVIESQTNKIFTLYESKIRISNSGSSNLNFSVPIKAVALSFGSSSTTSVESVRDEYRKHDIDLSWNGKKFVVKSINLQQINRSSFDNTANYVTTKTVLSPIDFFSRRTALQMTLFTSKAFQGTPSLYERTDATERAVTEINQTLKALVPVGTIIAWHKGMPGTRTLPSNWVECDGKVISDKTSPLYNQATPNLNGEGRFLRGSGQSGQFQNQDWKSLAIQGWAVKPGGYTHGPITIPKSGMNPTPFYGGAWGWSPDTSESNGLKFSYEESSEVRPVNMSVVWIIRVK